MNNTISQIISEITPLYNTYIENRHAISGTDALILMWDIGDILAGYINELNIKPHRFPVFTPGGYDMFKGDGYFRIKSLYCP